MEYINKRWLIKLRAASYLTITLGFTLLSLVAQYRLWKALWGIEIAIIAACVFELFRLVSLYKLYIWTGYKKILGVLSYLGIAIFCSLIATTNWYAEIIEQYSEQEQIKNIAYQEQITQINSAYAAIMNEKLASIDKDLYYIDSKIAANVKSKYWPKRKQQLLKSKQTLLNGINEFYAQKPKVMKPWINKNAALLDVNLKPVEYKESKYTAIEQAIRNTWNISQEQAQKLMAVVFVLAVEIMILYMASMTKNDINMTIQNEIPNEYDSGMTGSHRVDNNMTSVDNIIEHLESIFNHEDIKTFFANCKDSIMNLGRLPKSSELTAKLRPIRKVIADLNLNNDNLLNLYQYYCHS